MTKEMAIKILRGGVLETDELTHEAVFMAIRALKEQARVDAVPVVRCKDCKWYHNANDKYFPRTCDHWSEMFSHYEDWESVDENGFCSWGERREDA